ncbi:DUF4157 domain-containing protein [Calothrix sp. PCC 6303]|uniref:eCIS core domain-containing protein n=1 Tax=Calothrix sp. PCC 6303 TaxID=1170562 RepID=UPI0002A01D94|nr:DUF4157 domain-containing protein [Calothrix sp. PCC 6303]AFY99508.1 hypothetical protein Cal6303_0431 [Calothrix sp. PCC 6303]
MKTNENQKSTNHQPAAQKPFFGATPDHAFFSAERAASPPFFQPKAISSSAIQAKSATSEAEGINQPLVQQMPAFESEITANGEVHRKQDNSPASPIQAKLTIGEPGDKYEQEADRVASQVVEQINAPVSAQSTQEQSLQRQEEPKEELQAKPEITTLQRMEEKPEELQAKSTLQRQGEPEEELQAKPEITTLQRMEEKPEELQAKSTLQRQGEPEEELQAKPEITTLQRMEEKPEELQAKSTLQRQEAIAGGEASTDLDTAINSARGGGQPLDTGLQRSMGQSMGADFSGVRVHTDTQSDQLNQSIQAKAFTTGQDVFFRQGAYEPGSPGGQELIVHELTHVVQQGGGAVRRSSLPPQPLPQYPATAIPSASASDLPLQVKGAKTDDRPDSSVEQHPNKTGMPDALKAGGESLSGHSLDDVRVHYNSAKPAQLQALAYTQGTEIYVAPGQEKHLPHEMWHVVQQAEGRVKPTMQLQDGVAINNDKGLEYEADVMGAKAQMMRDTAPFSLATASPKTGKRATVQRVGEEKQDFNLAKTPDSKQYNEGENLFKEALVALRVLRRKRKDEIFASVTTGTKPVEGYSEAYGGGLKNLKNIELLKTTKQFNSPAPHLSLQANQVFYQGTKEGEATELPIPILVATLTKRTFQTLAKRPDKANRDVLSSGETDKHYVHDDRNVPTRRYAYVEKNYWQFMEFMARNKLEGRYQNFFRAANSGVGRPDVRGVRKSESKLIRGENDRKPLTNDQLAVLHQWKGSGLQQRGLSLTSTPRKGETIGNSGDNFRTNTGVRLTIDLARIPQGTDNPVLINHYAHSGVKDSKQPVTKVEKDYSYINSVLKNRELFLEFVKPEWIVNIEYHDDKGERKFQQSDKGADAMMDAARSGTGYDKFADGFAAQIASTALSDTDKDNPDYKAGVEFANEYNRGYKKGEAEVEVKPEGGHVDPLSQIGDFNPKKQKDVFAIGRIHGRVRRSKPTTLAQIWS